MNSALQLVSAQRLGAMLLAVGFCAWTGAALAATTVVNAPAAPAPEATAPSVASNATPSSAPDAQANIAEQVMAACHGGDVEACRILAQNYLSQQQYAQAARYLSKVCYAHPNAELGYQSCAALSTLLTDSSFGLNDYPQGIRVSEYLCNHGQSYGCLLLSSLYYIGDHVEQNLKTAADYGKRACDLKDATGCRQAALAIFSEAYMRHDLELFKESGKYHRAACDLGDAESCREVQEYDTKLKQFDIYVQNNTQSGHASS